MQKQTDNVEYLKDFSETLNLSGGLIEFSFAEKGTSGFRESAYFDQVDEDILQELLEKRENIAFAAGIDKNQFEKVLHQKTNGLGDIELRERVGRFTTDSMFGQKNNLAVDLDIKDFIDGFADWTPRDRYKKAKQIAQSFRKKFVRKFDDSVIWAIMFSGNGLHIHFKTKDYSIECGDADKYKAFYEILLSVLDKFLPEGAHFDRACKNPGRLMRLPFSRNYKNGKSVPTKKIYWDMGADASQFFRELNEAIDSGQFEASNSKLTNVASIPEGRRNSHLTSIAGTLRAKAHREF